MPTPFVTSRLLTALHGFSVRRGGISAAPYDSLNLGFSVGDVRESVWENLRRLSETSGIAVGALFTATQVHGDRVIEAPATPSESAQSLGDADALVATHPGVAVGVRTADCVPLLLEASDTGEVAAVHAGWKGTDLEITARTVERLVQRGARREGLRVAIGPSIRACCYEVSPELAERFRKKFGAQVVQQRGSPHLDLVAALQVTLERAGVAPSQIDVLSHCTSCDAEQFFSHRRDRGVTGRHLSFIRCERRPNS